MVCSVFWIKLLVSHGVDPEFVKGASTILVPTTGTRMPRGLTSVRKKGLAGVAFDASVIS